MIITKIIRIIKKDLLYSEPVLMNSKLILLIRCSLSHKLLIFI